MESDAGLRVRRGLVQHLESLQLAGVTHLPRAARIEHLPAAPVSAASQTALAAAGPDSARPTVQSGGPAVLQEPVSTPARNAPVTIDVTQPLSLDERRRKLADFSEAVAACRRCRELADTRTQTVFGVGNPEARIMFVGEAPGADEDRQGEPFVGRAGQLLNKIIEAMQMTREELYICNILRCRPPGNRNPSTTEAANCREFLDGQIAIVDPEYIVCWGTVAAQNLLDEKTPIGKMRGKFFKHGRAKVVCTYHPSYLLRNPAAKSDVWHDMKFLLRDMGIDLGTAQE